MKTTIGIFSLSLLTMVMISCGDGDGNTDKTVKVDNQEWMAENLNVSHYRNGDKIPEVKKEQEWKAYGEQGTGAWCYYDNDPANGKKYGKLYNWHAVNDPRGLAPKGWHVPSYAEWTTLTDNLGGKEIAGGKMKSTNGWVRDGGGTNESGFSGLPGGACSSDQKFRFIGTHGRWWTSTEVGTSNAWAPNLYFKDSYVGRDDFSKKVGVSVRCVRDSTI